MLRSPEANAIFSSRKDNLSTKTQKQRLYTYGLQLFSDLHEKLFQGQVDTAQTKSGFVCSSTNSQDE